MLRREHPTILGPLAIVPRMRFAQTIARDGTDNYARLEVYNALTLALLAMAPPPLVAPAAPPAGPPRRTAGRDRPRPDLAAGRPRPGPRHPPRRPRVPGAVAAPPARRA